MARLSHEERAQSAHAKFLTTPPDYRKARASIEWGVAWKLLPVVPGLDIVIDRAT